MSDQLKGNEAADNEDLFDFPEVQGFTPDFLEAARLQTEAATSNVLDTEPVFDHNGDDDFVDDFADDFSDLMGEPLEEAPQQEETPEPVLAGQAEPSGDFDFRFVWGTLALLFTANLVWAWTWHTSEDRLRGEMDQRFQSFLAQQKTQLTEAMDSLAPVLIARVEDPEAGVDSFELPSISASTTTIEDIKRDLTHSRFETARAKAWQLIARVDGLPRKQRARIEANARLLIAESYEVRSSTSPEQSR